MNTASKLGPHTQTNRGTCPGVGIWVYYISRYTTRGVDRGAQAIVRGGARFASQVLIMVHRPLPAALLVVRRRYLIVVPRPMPAAPRMYLIVVYRPMPTSPLVERRRYLIVVPRPIPAAVSSRSCRSSAKADACGRSFAMLSTQVSTVGLLVNFA